MKEFNIIKLILFFILCFFFAFSCVPSHLELERKVQNNIFYSADNPKMSIKVMPEFKYIGKIDTKKERETSTSERYQQHSFQVDKEFYFFGSIDADNIIHKVILISIHNLPIGYLYYPDDIFRNSKNVLMSGDKKINNVNYQYVVSLVNQLPEELQTLIDSKKYSTSPCYMSITFGKVIATQTLFYIQYFEDLNYNENAKKYKCNEWGVSAVLENEQRIFLKEFIKNSENAFQVAENNTSLNQEKTVSVNDDDTQKN